MVAAMEAEDAAGWRGATDILKMLRTADSVLPEDAGLCKPDVAEALDAGWFGTCRPSVARRPRLTSLFRELLFGCADASRNQNPASSLQEGSSERSGKGSAGLFSALPSIASPEDYTQARLAITAQAAMSQHTGQAFPEPAMTKPSSISMPTHEGAGSAFCREQSTAYLGPGSPPLCHASVVPHLGTWAHRQVRLYQPATSGSRHSQPGSLPSDKHPSEGTSGMRPVRSQEQLQADSDPMAQPPHKASNNVDILGASDKATDAAWRWRFARKWHAEQQRCLEADGTGSCHDKTEDALQFLHAGGGAGWHMQVGATMGTTSVEGSKQSQGTLQGLGSLTAQDLLLMDDGSYQYGSSLMRGGQSLTGRPLAGGAGMLAATREVASMNRRAVQLLAQQQELERAADERWRQSCGAADNWIGTYLNTVEIDEWGVFKFLVLRVRGRHDRQRILLRGHNYCCEASLLEDVNQKMAAISAQRGLAMEAVEVMGGGVMEWRKDRDRHVHLHSGFVSHCSMPVGRPASAAELLNLAGVLARQGLASHYKLSIEGCRE
ncbi:hypothetical protein V8C86DRAFT_2600051 [Haematococcus lacustris]